ncbi:MAG TPA: C25 family cysteine peptidase [Thermoguttaceae bacterium]|nr:C25 family cysteine peptidase [Thermoguttaceae bacterium]
MFSDSAIRCARRGAVSIALGVALLGVQLALSPAVLQGQELKREYVPLVPDVERGAPPTVIARALTFGAEAGVGTIPLEIVPVGFWRSRLALLDDEYDLFEFEVDASSHLTEVGEPNVPMRVVQVDIPPNARLDEVVLEPELLKTVNNVTLAPNQEPKPIDPRGLIRARETFTIDAELYEAEAAYPGKFHEVTTTGGFGSRKVVILKTFPVQFHPATRTAKFYKLTGALKFKAKEVPEAKEKRDVLGVAERALGLSPSNLADAERWNEYPRRIGPELLEQFQATGFPQRARKAALEGIPCVIICADLFYCPSRDLASHHTKKGIATAVVRARAVENSIGGADAPDKIRNFIRILYQRYRTRSIILFGDVVGDGSRPFVDVPTRMVVDPAPYAGVDDGWIPCDYYYACIDGTWDGNNNGKYGEAADEPDLLPDLCVGRIPTNDFEVAQRVVSSIVKYGNAPPTATGALLAANDLGWGCHEVTFKEETVLPLVKPCTSVGVKRLYEKQNNLTASTFANVVNHGVDFIEYYGHGSPDSTQLMTAAQVDSMLQSTPSLPVVFALSCSTSRYDCRECFGEAWIEGVKASAYVGSTRVAYGGTSSGEGLDVRFIGNYCKLGKTGRAVDLAKYQLFKDFGWNTYTLKTILEFTLFGDPVMDHVK